MKNRIAKAEYLYRELGNINDRYLNEALTYRPHARSPRLLLIAACLCLSVLFVFGAISISNRKGDDLEADTKLHSIDAILENVPQYDQTDTLTPGTPALVWQRTGSEELFVHSISNAEFIRLSKQMQQAGNVGTESPTPTYRFWIVASDGTVRTPYLKSSPGNIGVTLFDYEVEVLPDQTFLDCLSDILN